MTELSSYVIGLYIRLSIEDSKVDSLSIENQKIALHKFVDFMEGVRNIEVLEFVDNGYSGTNFERPAVQELLEAVKEGKINCIIVKDFTRFGRNSIEVGYFMEMVFPLYGVRFISINDDFDSDRYLCLLWREDAAEAWNKPCRLVFLYLHHEEPTWCG